MDGLRLPSTGVRSLNKLPLPLIQKSPLGESEWAIFLLEWAIDLNGL